MHLRGQLVLLPAFVSTLMPEPALVVFFLQPLEYLSLLGGVHQALTRPLHLLLLRGELLHQLLPAKGHLRAVPSHRPELAEIDASGQIIAQLTLGRVDGVLHIAKLLLHGLGLLLHLGQLTLALPLGAPALLEQRFVLEGEAGHGLSVRKVTVIYDREKRGSFSQLL